MKCKLCSGPCMPPEVVAKRLRRLMDEAEAWIAEAKELGLAEDPGHEFLAFNHDQLASELEGICTDCRMNRTMREMRWTN